jgi:signal transduction histidine kinase
MKHDFSTSPETEAPFSSYIHQLSHDVRTPLNHINGFAELLLLDGDLSATNAQYVSAIIQGSQALQAAIFSHIDFMERVMAVCGGLIPSGCQVGAAG